MPETLDFINQIRHSFRKLGNSTGFIRGAHQISPDPEQPFTTLVLPGNFREDMYRTAGKPALTSGQAFPHVNTIDQKSTEYAPLTADLPNSIDWDLETFLVSSEKGNLPGLLPLSSLDLREGNSSDFDFFGSVDFDPTKAILGQPLWDDVDLRNVIGMCDNDENFLEKKKFNGLGYESASRPLTTWSDFGQQPGESSTGKGPKKRARPGESTRPRPRDRQQIQDRVKELREIVPNGAKVIPFLSLESKSKIFLSNRMNVFCNSVALMLYLRGRSTTCYSCKD